MGNEQSSDLQSSTLESETKSKSFFRRSSTLPTKMKAPKLKNLSDFQYAASYLSLRIENFSGVRHDQQYAEIERQIVEVSMELQKYRASLLRDADKTAADGVQKNISDCLAALLRKAQENERLDGDAVETNSFVAQSLPEQQPVQKQKEEEVGSLVEKRNDRSYQSQPSLRELQKEHRKSKSRQSVAKVPPKYQKRMQTLMEIERAVLEVKTNVTNAIFCQQMDSFDRYESKIKNICRDLELVDVDDHSPLYTKKKELYDLLIKCNNNIKKTRRRMQRQVAVDIPDYILARSEMESLDEDIHRTETLLQNEEEYFDDLKLKFLQLLEKVAAVKNNSELQERKRIATEVIKSNLTKIQFLEIQKKLNNIQSQIVAFRDVKYSPSFVKLDQQLRQLWDEVPAIEGSQERKFKVIGEIQKAIQLLLKKAEDNEGVNEALLLQTAQLERQSKAEDYRLSNTVTDSSQNYGKQNNVTNDVAVYQNNEIFRQQEQQKSQVNVTISKDPLPTPREEPIKQKHLEEIIDEFIGQWHGLKLQSATSKWTQVEKARIKIKMANMVSSIQDILETIENQEYPKHEEKKQDDVVILEDTVDNAHKYEESKQIVQVNSKPVLHVKPETSKSFKEESGKKSTFAEPETNKLPKEAHKAKKDATSERLAEMQAAVEGLRRKVNTFNEAVRNVEYEKVKNSIEQCVTELKSLQPKGKALLEEVYELAETLEIKVANNQAKSIKTRATLKELVEKLQSLKKRIDNFTGTYRNVLYTKIEDDLKLLIEDFKDLNSYGDKKLHYAINQTRQKAQQYLNILESKSAKLEDVQETLLQKRASSASYENIQKIRNKLLEIKSTAENFKGFSDEPIYRKMRSELESCAKQLNDIEDHGRSSLQESKQQFLNYIDEMLRYLEQNVKQRTSDEYVITPIVTEKVDPKKQLEQIEESLEITAQKVEEFRGKQADKLYSYLDEVLILTLIALDNVTIKDDEMAQRKTYLISNVHQYSKLLSEKAKARKLEESVERLEAIRTICNSIKFEIDCRDELDDHAYSEFNERLVNLLIKVDDIKSEDESGKQNCKECISEVLRTLQGKVNYKIKFISDLDGVHV